MEGGKPRGHSLTSAQACAATPAFGQRVAAPCSLCSLGSFDPLTSIITASAVSASSHSEVAPRRWVSYVLWHNHQPARRGLVGGP